MHCKARDHRARMNKHLRIYGLSPLTCMNIWSLKSLFEIQTASKFYFLIQYFKKNVFCLVKGWNHSAFFNPISVNTNLSLGEKYCKSFFFFFTYTRLSKFKNSKKWAVFSPITKIIYSYPGKKIRCFLLPFPHILVRIHPWNY